MSSTSSTISTESNLEAVEVSTGDSSNYLPEIVIREVLTIDEIIKNKGYINIFEENFIGYLQGLLKNRSKAEIFNSLYERYRIDQKTEPLENECYIPILANIRDTIEHRIENLQPDEHVQIEDADEFTKLYIDFRKKMLKNTEPNFTRRLENYLDDPFTLPLLSLNTNAEMEEYIPERMNQHVCVGENMDDIMVLHGHTPGITLRRMGTAFRAPNTTESTTLSDRQKVAVDAISPKPILEIPTFETTLALITPEMEIHDIIVLLERNGFPLFNLSIEQFEKLREKLEEEAEFPEIPDYGEASDVGVSVKHEDRIKEYWNILRRAVDSVSVQIRNRPIIDSPDEWPDSPNIQEMIKDPAVTVESIIDTLKTFKRDTYKKIINNIYQDYQKSVINVEKNTASWDKFIEPWIKYVFSYEFQFVKLYNELEEIRIAEDTQNYIGTIYDGDGFVGDADGDDAVDAIDDDIGGEYPFKDLDYPEEADGAPAGAAVPMEEEEEPLEENSIMNYTVIDDYITENLDEFGSPLMNDIIMTLQTFIKFWVYNTGLSKYFNPELLKIAMKEFKNKNSRVEELQRKVAEEKYDFLISYNNYQVNYLLEKPKKASDRQWKKLRENIDEVDRYFLNMCQSYLVELAYKWAEYLYENYILNVKNKHGIFPENQMTSMQRPYWNPFGFPLANQELKKALLKPGLLKYLTVTAQQTMYYLLLSGRNYIQDNIFFNINYYETTYGEYFYKYLNRNIESLETLQEVEVKQYHKFFSHFEYDLFQRDYKTIVDIWLKVKDELNEVNPERLLQLRRCEGDNLIKGYTTEILKNRSKLYDITLSSNIAAEYVKIYRCLAAMVLNQDYDNSDEALKYYNEYLRKYYHKGRMILQIGTEFKPDSDWIQRINKKKVKDLNARMLLLIKSKIKYNRFAYIPKYRLFSYLKHRNIDESSEDTQINKMIELPPISDIESITITVENAPTIYEILYSSNKVNINLLYQHFANKNKDQSTWNSQSSTINYTYYRTLSKRLMKIAYMYKKNTTNQRFKDNLETIINMQKELTNLESENLNTLELSKIYRDVCILIVYLNNWTQIIMQENYTRNITDAISHFIKEWSTIPNNYTSVNNIITEQREKNKVKQLEEINSMGQEKANLQKELISKGFKK